MSLSIKGYIEYLTLLFEFRCSHLVHMPADQVLINLLGVVHALHGVRPLDLIKFLQMYVHASKEKRVLMSVTHLFR